MRILWWADDIIMEIPPSPTFISQRPCEWEVLNHLPDGCSREKAGMLLLTILEMDGFYHKLQKDSQKDGLSLVNIPIWTNTVDAEEIWFFIQIFMEPFTLGKEMRSGKAPTWVWLLICSIISMPGWGIYRSAIKTRMYFMPMWWTKDCTKVKMVARPGNWSLHLPMARMVTPVGKEILLSPFRPTTKIKFMPAWWMAHGRPTLGKCFARPMAAIAGKTGR